MAERSNHPTALFMKFGSMTRVRPILALPLYGKRVVTEGYLGSEFAVGKLPIPVSWDGEIPKVPFLSGQNGN